MDGGDEVCDGALLSSVEDVLVGAIVNAKMEITASIVDDDGDNGYVALGTATGERQWVFSYFWCTAAISTPSGVVLVVVGEENHRQYHSCCCRQTTID